MKSPQISSLSVINILHYQKRHLPTAFEPPLHFCDKIVRFYSCKRMVEKLLN